MRICLDKFEFCVTRAGALNHLRGKVDSHAAPGLERGKQISPSTADLQDTLIRTDQKTIDVLHAAMIESPPAVPRIAFICNAVPVRYMTLLVFRGGLIV